MTDAALTPTRLEAMFARLAEMDLAAAEKAHGKFMAAEEASDIAELGRTYQRMARSLRQTLALNARLARAREAVAQRRARAEAWDELVRPRLRVFEPELPPERRPARLDEVRAAIRPIIEREAPERERADALTGELEAFLSDLADHGDWAAPLEDHILQACMVIGVDGHPGVRYADDEGEAGDDEEEATRRSYQDSA